MTTTVTVTQADFQRVVLQSGLPVLVDFWADWCGPCKSLAPVLDKLAADYDGRLVIAKVNVDEEQQIAAAIGIRSLPTMLLFVGGRPVEQIVGAQPEANIRAVIDRFVEAAEPADGDELPAPGATSAETLARLEALLQEDPENVKARIAVARVHVVNGDFEAAREALAQLDQEAAASDEAKQVGAALELATLASESPQAPELRTRADNDPKDFDARIRLAARLASDGAHDEAAELLLDVIRRKKTFEDGAAQRRLLQLIDLLGPKDERVAGMRRRMMSALY